ncbi:MAG: hypothetical protein ACT6FD_00885 [Methanosarcinaceae archaeon]
MTQFKHIEAIEKRLWGAVDTMRANSNYASSEYFMPVMRLVFLSRYLAANDGIVVNLPSRGEKTRAFAKDEFSQQSTIFLHPRAQFDYLAALFDSEDRAEIEDSDWNLTPGGTSAWSLRKWIRILNLRKLCMKFMWSWKTLMLMRYGWRRLSRRILRSWVYEQG